MAAEWPTATVAELERAGVLLVQDGNHGASRPTADEILGEGIPHVRAADIRPDGSIDLTGAQKVSETAWNRIKKGRSRPGDVLLTHKGTVGRVAVVPQNAGRVLCSPQTTFWRSLDSERLHQGFVAVFLRAELFRTQLRRVMHETDMAPYVSLTSQRALRVPLPPMAYQQTIATILRAFADKIESNVRLVAKAEQVTACVSGRVARVGPYADWITQPFSTAVDVNPRVAIPRGTLTPFVEMAAVAPFATRPDLLCERPFSGGSKFERGDTLMARITGCIEHGKGAFVDFVDVPSAGSTEFVVFRPKPPLSPEVVFALSRNPILRAHAIANMVGTSGRQRVDNACWSTIEVAIAPESAERAQALELASAQMQLSRGAWKEARSLSEIRDRVLPKLVSGQVRVPLSNDAEEQVGAALEASA